MEFYVSEPFGVRFSETDMAGVVHFSQILRWAENAEGEFFRKHGLSLVSEEAGMLSGWPRVRVEASFLAPLRYGDCVRVKIRPRSLPEEDSVALHWMFEVVCMRDGRELLAARGSWTSVYASINPVSGELRSRGEIPADLKKVLKNFKIA